MLIDYSSKSYLTKSRPLPFHGTLYNPYDELSSRPVTPSKRSSCMKPYQFDLHLDAGEDQTVRSNRSNIISALRGIMKRVKEPIIKLLT